LWFAKIVVHLQQNYKYFPKIGNKIPKNVSLVETIKRYFTNLFRALVGNNPFRMELDEVREMYEKTAERVSELQEYYFKMVEQMDHSKRQMKGYQQLIENLRDRVGECQEEVAHYRKENNRLRRLLQPEKTNEA